MDTQLLSEKQLKNYAEVLIWALGTARTKPFEKNDVILIRYDMLARRFAEIIFKKLLEMGYNPVQRLNSSPDMEFNFYDISDNDQLVFQAPGDKELYNSLKGLISLRAPESITHLSSIDPQKIGKASIARKYIRDILNAREETGDFGWTLCSYPTPVPAKHADLTPEVYAEQIANACFIDEDNPVEKWEEIFSEATRIKTWLNSLDVDYYHVKSANTDLKVYPGEKRKWIGISGHNIPSFELFLSPDYRKTTGTYFADQPSFQSGNYVKNIRIQFKDGIAVTVNADEGESFTQKQLTMDKGAGRLGEFSLTDKRFSRINRFMADTLFDENFGGKNGNCHVALGSSYSDTYDGDPSELTSALKEELGFNDSALHWDIINTEEKTVTAMLKSGEMQVIYKDGMFTF